MNPRLSRGEYWLLSSVLDSKYPVTMLGMPDDPPPEARWRATIGEFLNRDGHGLDRRELIRVLERMSRRGWLQFNRIGGPVLSLGRSGIVSAIDERGLFRDSIFYSLTGSGGAVWEAFSRPCWDSYVDYSSEREDGADETSVEVFCGSQHSLDRYRRAAAAECWIVPGSECVEALMPWQATYWKTRPTGWRLTYRFRDLVPPREPRNPEWVRRRDSWIRWF